MHDPATVGRRTAFCASIGVDYQGTVYQRIVYQDNRTYHLIAEVDGASVTSVTPEVVADSLYTTTPGVALFLPVADCAATVLYDPVKRAIATAHLGRHSTYARLADHLVRHFVANGSSPADLIVWMSPHAQKDSYTLDWFDRSDNPDWQGFYEQKADGVHIDLAGFNRRCLEQQGVQARNIYVSSVDTMARTDYFSHRAGDHGGRIAVVAQMQ